MDRPFYLTTAIHYPNGNPHMGHALEWVQADFFARYYRTFSNQPVLFQVGLDDHGLKIYRTAEKAGKNVKDFVDEKSLVFKKLAEDLHIAYDRFIRTSESAHQAMAQSM